ncbi:TetR/AcrR family transcriptional regulator [Kutzneria viridogrisea]|uniref:HTH tetR-type domain-containing protein n=2 Tax=Kutzneria TaxID=43356 RepID=W5VZF5_9PSEU|nr:TetR/AcrR family transcriptional regulator [Kutzneria albida]AHH93860.1 hypothetical protein KALB_484 [Kutzneria albida DSM 43870]MBA8931135.1 AcrR family transcriptional regulator [Kutzneria viridogrisea]
MTTASSKRPYAARLPPQERREQLLDAALLIINTDGVGAVSVDAVARTAGVTRPVVYGQFADTGDILRTLLTREEQRALAQLAELLPREPAEHDPVELFTATLDGFLRAVTAHPDTWRAILLPVDGVPPPVRRHVERADRQLRDRFAALCRWALGEREVDVELLAESLLALMKQAGRLVLAERELYPPERITAFGRAMASAFLS